MAEEFDLLIRGGTVVDGTGAPRLSADVAVRDGKIAAVGEALGQAKQTLDVDGRVVAPGFVEGSTQAMTPIGLAMVVTPRSSSTSITPTEGAPLRSAIVPVVLRTIFVALSSVLPRPLCSAASRPGRSRRCI